MATSFANPDGRPEVGATGGMFKEDDIDEGRLSQGFARLHQLCKGGKLTYSVCCELLYLAIHQGGLRGGVLARWSTMVKASIGRGRLQQSRPGRRIVMLRW